MSKIADTFADFIGLDKFFTKSSAITSGGTVPIVDTIANSANGTITTAGSTITTTTGPTTGTSGQVWMTTGTGWTNPLSKEEQEELESLKEQRRADTKQIKIEEFKKLPPEIRQQALNRSKWIEESSRISDIEASKSIRQHELEAKQTNGSGSITIHNGGWGSTSGTFKFSPENVIPDGLTLDDIEKAHIDASLEEEVLNNG